VARVFCEANNTDKLAESHSGGSRSRDFKRLEEKFPLARVFCEANNTDKLVESHSGGSRSRNFN